MKPTINVGKNVKNPNYDVKLTDVNGREIALILANSKGASDRRGMIQANMPRTAMQVGGAGNAYDDMEMPYSVEVQSSMIGGRGMDDFVKDKTKYADGFRMDTSSVNPILGPAVIRQSGYKEAAMRFDQPAYGWQTWATADPGPVLDVVEDYMSVFVTGTKTFTGMSLYIHGWVGVMTIYYGIGYTLNDHEYKLPYSMNVYGNGSDQWVNLPFPPVTINNAAVTWGFGFSQRAYILAAIAPGVTTYSTFGTGVFHPIWATGQCWMSGLLYEANCEYKFFEYKRALYMVKNALDGNSATIYRNGYRGLALPNPGANLAVLATTLNVPNNSLKGAIALISNGPGEMERQNWREIISNNTNRFAVSSPWNIEHTTSTEFVILGTVIWTQVLTISKKVTDVIALQDYYVLAFGDAANLLFVQESNVAGVWTQATYWNYGAQDAAGGIPDRYDFLSLTQDVKGRLQLWGANANTSKVSCARLPGFGTNPVFDIWLDEHANYQLSIDRLTADYAAVPAGTENDPQRTKLLRQKDDATAEKAKLLSYIQAGDTSSHITNMVIYGAPGIPYILKEGEIGSIDQNVYAKIPIAEIEAVRSERNGRAAMAYGVYLYFNLEGGWIERYYDQRMDDVSLNQNEGLPKDRQGEISKLMAYAGRWYASVDAGTSGISAVYVNNELGWHEIYRSEQVGKSITDIHAQAIPGVSNPDMLWISEGTDILAIPIAISPTKQERYTFFGAGLPKDQVPYVETPWIDFNYKDVNKYFHSINLFVDMPGQQIKTGSEYETFVWFRTDQTDPNAWIYVGSGNAMPNSQEFFMLIDGEHKAWGKQIKFKIGMKSNVTYKTPRLKAWVCNAIVRFEVKKSWNLTFQLQPDKDLLDRRVIMDPNELYDALELWANSKWHATPLYMNTNDPMTDGLLVFVDPMSVTRTSVELAQNERGSAKTFIHLASMLVYEV